MSLYTDHGSSTLPTYFCSLAAHWTVNDHIYSTLSPAYSWRLVKSETHFSNLLPSASLSNDPDFSLPHQQTFSSGNPPLKEQLWITVFKMEFQVFSQYWENSNLWPFSAIQYTQSDSQSMLSVVTRSSLFLNIQHQWPTNSAQEVIDDVLIYRLHVTCTEGRVKSCELAWLCAAH
jgi:hypothetical protein